MTIDPVGTANEPATQTTGPDGCVTWTNLGPGSYTVSEAAPTSGNPWFNTDPGPTCLIGVTCAAAPQKTQHLGSGDEQTVSFGNLQSGEIKACKYEDDNVNGADDDEPRLTGWAMTLDGGAQSGLTTGDDGCVSFYVLPTGNTPLPSSHSVYETLQDGPPPWFNTDPAIHDLGAPCLPSTCPTPTKSDIMVGAGGSTTVEFGNIEAGKINVCKYNDSNANGQDDGESVPCQNDGEPALGGWAITVDPTGVNLAGTTDDDGGCVSFFVLPTHTVARPGAYTVQETLQGGPPPWFNTDPAIANLGHPCLPSTCPTPSKSATVSAGGTTCVEFGNIQSAEKDGEKFYDVNADGFKTGDAGVSGFKIVLTGTAVDGSTVTAVMYTNSSGNYSFKNLLPSCDTPPCLEVGYTVTEIPPNSTWVNTTPTSITFGLDSGEVEKDNDFGNVCLGGGNGLTLGFWSNKNGQAAITGADLCALNALNLRSASSAFDPVVGCPSPTTAQINAGKTALKNWLLSATATNMAYMLSAQLATMKLNVIQPIGSSSVSSSALVFAGTPPSGCSVAGLSGTGFISIADLMNDANAAITGATRPCQEFLKTTLDRANNNLNFVQSSACRFTSPY